MLPYIGENYGNSNKPKIMLIAESHYFPPDSTINKDPQKWYNATQKDLNVHEIAWGNTRGVVGSDWKSAGHMIFRELNSRLEKFVGSSNSRAMNNIVFMNGFQRPANETGESIKYFCRPIDFEIGLQTILSVSEIVKPDLIIFVSKFTWDKFGWELAKHQNKIKIDYVYHPATGGRYWHNKKYPHGVEKFKKLIKIAFDENAKNLNN